jgi:nitric oxide reductase activation protein
VRLTRIKDFDEPLDEKVVARLAGLSSGLSTRLGAALRHSGAELAPQRTTRKLVLVLTDGEPSDIDVVGPQELVEDARRAARSLRQVGIDVFGIVMDPQGVGSAMTIFGRHNTMYVRHLQELPAKLAGVYFRLAQR